jgi:hypothetical protein
MHSIYIEKRSVFVTTDVVDEKIIREAKFKLAEFRYGYGRYENGHYWSFPFDQCAQGYQILKSLFSHIQQI